MVAASWTLSLNWETPAGRVLKRFAASIPDDQSIRLTVFGSAPIQMMVEQELLSADVDVFSDSEGLEKQVRVAELGEGQADLYLQVSSELNFRSSPRWRDRVQEVTIGQCTIVFPHPLDILIGKLIRLEEKDIEAFHIVVKKTGHPSEDELLQELQMSVDLFRPGFDEEKTADLTTNCRRLWPLIFGREIDPRSEIIAPALTKRRKGYGNPSCDYKQELKEAAGEGGGQ
ncbi:MAG TPA: hypothetical protein EYQ50_05675 [Verrucomicrobiales bacterium]|nr:hypothetical protein [Verrucomicrobiales bacterium]HIL72492.1 hypothetical protein [Verrucomicrobiota bacterium]